MNALKDAIIVQNKSFMQNLETINSNLIKDQEDLRARNTDLSNQINKLKVRSENQEGNLKELYSRTQKAEDKLDEVNKYAIALGQDKTDDTVFKQNIQRIDDIINTLDTKVSSTNNHTIALDNYLDKYQPVRMQQMIAETLEATLTGVERRNHELYNNDKTSLFYRLILSDEEEGSSIQKLVVEMNNVARQVIDEEEKQARRYASLATRQAGSNKKNKKSPKAKQSPRSDKKAAVSGEQVVDEDGQKKEKYRYWDPIRKGFNTALSS